MTLSAPFSVAFSATFVVVSSAAPSPRLPKKLSPLTPARVAPRTAPVITSSASVSLPVRVFITGVVRAPSIAPWKTGFIL